MKQFITRAYNQFKINKNGGTITKISADSKLSDELNYYNLIHKDPFFTKYFPRVFDSGKTEKNEVYVELEYLNYSNLSDKMIYNNSIVIDEWISISTQLYNVLESFRKISPNNGLNYDDAFQKMYIDKTLTEFKKLSDSDEFFEKLTASPSVTINGTKYDNFIVIKDEIVNLIEKRLLHGPISVIHGDFCFGNILASVNLNKDITSLRLIDPRGSWGNFGIFGDPRYDIAKLYHSFDGCYEYITNDKFSLEQINESSYNFSFSNDNMIQIAKILKDNCIDKFPNDPIEYELIQGLIFIGMCARHYDSKQRQIIMYLTGVRILNNLLQRKK